MGYSGPGWGEIGTYVESQTVKPTAATFGLRSSFSVWSVRKTRWEEKMADLVPGKGCSRLLPQCGVQVIVFPPQRGSSYAGSRPGAASVGPVLFGNPKAHQPWCLGCSALWLLPTGVLAPKSSFVFCLFCYIKVGVSRCQITGVKYHVPQTSLTPIPYCWPHHWPHSGVSAMEGGSRSHSLFNKYLLMLTTCLQVSVLLELFSGGDRLKNADKQAG